MGEIHLNSIIMNKKNKEILIFKRKNNKNMNDKKIKLIDSIQVKKLLK